MAMFMFLTFRHYIKNWIFLVFLWAGIIGYAQIYVGVHYPSDIAGGMILGILYGILSAYIFNKYFGLYVPGEQNT
jgi:undecaprenyl-diphosphatase